MLAFLLTKTAPKHALPWYAKLGKKTKAGKSGASIPTDTSIGTDESPFKCFRKMLFYVAFLPGK